MPDELEQTWTAIREQLHHAVTEITFQLYLEPLSLAARDATTLFVCAPDHVRDLVEERYLPVLRAAAARATGDAPSVEVVGADWSPSGSRAQPTVDLNPRYTFEQFVIGPGNRFAHAAALAVAEQPGCAYNPLFVHGPPGLGKTHLLHAIANFALAREPSLHVRYATVEEFTGEFVQAMRRGDPAPFRRRFRDADLLLLDDVQFLAERARTKEELFHTFNALYETGRQVVLSSDRSPANLRDFEDRLRERFASGLVTELERPDFDVRLAILRRRAAADFSEVAEDALEELARRVSSSVRALEGGLVRLVAGASLRGVEPSPELVSDLFAGAPACADDPSAPIAIAAIQEAVASAYGVPADSLLEHDRRPVAAGARQIAMYLARELTDASFPEIGRAFGGRNHSTVLHSCRRAGRRCAEDPATAALVDKLRRSLGATPADRAR